MKKQFPNPLVSVIILTYKDGLKNIKSCLKSLNKISYSPIEIILVDNASTDNTVEYVRDNFPKVRMIENKKNLGFCKGNNQAADKAHGKYILLLNNDTQVPADFLEHLVKDLEEDSTIGVVQPKIRQLLEKSKLDACASYLTNTGFLYHYGYSQNQKLKKYNERLLMYSAKGACLLTRKDLIKKIGLFDDDYFAYFEDTDFCHRVWLAGLKVMYEPASEIYHLGGVNTEVSSVIQFHSYKNRIATYIKNLGTKQLFITIPIHVAICFFIAVLYLAKGKVYYSYAIFCAIIWNISNINKILSMRKKVQRRIRRVEDFHFLSHAKKNVKVSYYKHILLNPRGYYKFEEN